MKKIIFLLLFFAINYNLNAQYKQPSIRCIGVELDGSQTLRVSGYGRNRTDAKEQAMKNAVWAVIFDGIRDGVQGCNMKPLLTEVNAKERYEDYFNKFFSDGGNYKKYVSLKDTKKLSANNPKTK